MYYTEQLYDSREQLYTAEGNQHQEQEYIHRCPFKHCPHTTQNLHALSNSLPFLNVFPTTNMMMMEKDNRDNNIPNNLDKHFNIQCSTQYIKRSHTSKSCPDSPILSNNKMSCASKNLQYVSAAYRQKAIKFIMTQLCQKADAQPCPTLPSNAQPCPPLPTHAQPCGALQRLQKSVQRLEHTVYTTATEKEQYIQIMALKVVSIKEEMKNQEEEIKNNQDRSHRAWRPTFQAIKEKILNENCSIDYQMILL